MCKYSIEKEHRDMLVKMYLGGMSIRNLLCHKIAKSYGISNHGEFVHFVLTPSILKGE